MSRIENGLSIRDHLRAIERRKDIRIDELHPDPPPNEVIRVWDWFMSLHQSRDSNGYRPNPIRFSDMRAWFNFMGITPIAWEVEILQELDSVYLKTVRDNA